ncbi:hypothetical protein [Myxococcus virescens]|uniref:Uncharacterized protein n=1 Tax=Myxococcus virescens TaxID=83456 RepID=A0A511HNP3_9BACT|nr:hypothetical protein [Myxococcus virescens]GEL75210.1 hypothetical protein MVI01_69940 [Myxococcus virescens]SDD65313.1 hypothetical protein SAMN04488504_102135 [Myxococcus virescens]
MATAGYVAEVKVAGAPVAFTGAATEDMGDDVYRIADATRRVWDMSAPVEVLDDGTPLPASGYVVDYLCGRVSLVAPPVGVVTVSASFLPTVSVAEVRSVTINATATELDTSILGVPYTTFVNGKRGAEVSLEALSLVTEDIAPGQVAETWDEVFAAGSVVLVDVALGGGAVWRGWCRVPSVQSACPSDGLYAGSISAKTVPVRAAGRSEAVAFGLRTGE